MKRIMALILAVSLTGCGTPLKVVKPDGAEVTYPTYGLLDESQSKSRDVCYEIAVGNVALGIALYKTYIAPIYFFGFSMWNPSRLKKDENDDCLATKPEITK